MSELAFGRKELEEWSNGLTPEVLGMLYKSSARFAQKYNIAEYMANLSHLTEPFDEERGGRDPQMPYATPFFRGMLVGTYIGKSVIDDDTSLMHLEDFFSVRNDCKEITDQEIAKDPEQTREYVEAMFQHSDNYLAENPFLERLARDTLGPAIAEENDKRRYAVSGIAIGYEFIHTYHHYHLSQTLEEYAEQNNIGARIDAVDDPLAATVTSELYDWDLAAKRLAKLVDIELE